MGKGDRKTRKGKVHQGTFGVTRLKKRKRKFPEHAAAIQPPKKASTSKNKSKPKAKAANKKDDTKPSKAAKSQTKAKLE